MPPFTLVQVVLVELGTGSRRDTICRCRQGTIAATQENPAHHQQQVDSLWQLWQQQQQLFKPQASVDIQVSSKLLRFTAALARDTSRHVLFGIVLFILCAFCSCQNLCKESSRSHLRRTLRVASPMKIALHACAPHEDKHWIVCLPACTRRRHS